MLEIHIRHAAHRQQVLNKDYNRKIKTSFITEKIVKVKVIVLHESAMVKFVNCQFLITIHVVVE